MLRDNLAKLGIYFFEIPPLSGARLRPAMLDCLDKLHLAVHIFEDSTVNKVWTLASSGLSNTVKLVYDIARHSNTNLYAFTHDICPLIIALACNTRILRVRFQARSLEA